MIDAPPPPIAIVDAFADGPFTGNPAAVCPLAAPASAPWMQAVAAEMNLSETAFVVPRAADAWDLRWFTPLTEVALCGHATLATAHFLAESGLATPGAVCHFHTRSGILSAQPDTTGWTLDFPRINPVPSRLGKEVWEALGCMVHGLYEAGEDLLVELPDAAAVRELRPDHTALARIDRRGICVTAASDDDRYDLISRFFAPCEGIAEDPVTGSAHCALGPFWATRLGRTTLRAWQASRRGGQIAVTVTDDRVHLGGHAVTVLRGQLAAPPPPEENA